MAAGLCGWRLGWEADGHAAGMVARRVVWQLGGRWRTVVVGLVDPLDHRVVVHFEKVHEGLHVRYRNRALGDRGEGEGGH